MKIKKYLGIVLMLVLACSVAVVISCSKDDDNKGNNDDNSENFSKSAVVGTWSHYENNSYGGMTYSLVFNSDGTGFYKKKGESGSGSKDKSTDMKYQMTSANEGLLTLISTSGSYSGSGYNEETFKFIIKGETLELYEIFSDGRLDLEMTFTKVKE